LLSGPGNATLNSSSGAFSWRPSVANANTTNLISLMVADNGTPGMSTTQAFTIVVNPLAPFSMNITPGSGGQMIITFDVVLGPDYLLQESTNLTQWNTLFITNPVATPFAWITTNNGAYPANFYRVLIGPPGP
jgi:hypothetical protein